MQTYMANPDKIERKWYVVDAEGCGNPEGSDSNHDGGHEHGRFCREGRGGQRGVSVSAG